MIFHPRKRRQSVSAEKNLSNTQLSGEEIDVTIKVHRSHAAGRGSDRHLPTADP